MSGLDVIEVALLMSFVVACFIWEDLYQEWKAERKRAKSKEELHA